MGQGPFAFLDGPKELALSGISHLDLTVTDLDRSLAFYVDVLGFRFGQRFDRPRFRGAFITHPGLTHSIGLGCPDARDGSSFDEYRTGLDHLSLRVPSHKGSVGGAALRELPRGPHPDRRFPMARACWCSAIPTTSSSSSSPNPAI
jgi:catechol 2,3-dioxygenase-like lactoylglutathione lyase family enzyme